ncbi:MAG: hypothetical protein CVU11_03280 [Bacteroidetes bacterium HGW-Bacteroidetes-6]|jgi:hypothetical protein|nr:MAG: hypothetical protein CVU11_03280 [Bacteroidetes bacterium HGW-Bacteroidetes-6]
MEQPTQNFNPVTSGFDEQIKAHLAGTKGWLMFLGILNIVIAGIYTLATLGIGILFTWIPFLLGLFLINAANRIKAFLLSGQEIEMVNYHKQMKNFFMTTGIITIISIGLSIIMVVVALSMGLNGRDFDFLKAFK